MMAAWVGHDRLWRHVSGDTAGVMTLDIQDRPTVVP